MSNNNEQLEEREVVGITEEREGYRIGGENSPLHLAAACGQVAVLNFLVEKGASIDIKNELEQTPLHLAALCGSLDSVNALVEAGANMNAQDSDGHTPMMLAIMGGSCDSFCNQESWDAV